jgi:hypothetical protein
MHKEKASMPANFSQWLHPGPARSIKHADLSAVHERVSLYEFKQMGFDVCANDAVRLDDRARIRIHIVPKPAHLRLQPTPQRTKQVCQTFANGVGTFDAFKSQQEIVRQIGASPVFARAGIPSWSFHDDFVHVWSHDDLMVDG